MAGVFFAQDLEGRSANVNVAAAVGYDPSYDRAYQEYYGARNVYLIRGRQLLRPGNVCPSHMLCPDGEVLRSEFYNGWVKPQHQGDGLLATVFREESLVSMIGVTRSNRARPFGREDVQAFRLLMPHLRRAVAIHRRIVGLEVERQSINRALDHWPLGVILIGRDGRTLLSNRSAEAILNEKDGLVLERGGLRAALPDETVRLRSFIRDAIETNTGLGASGGGTLTISRPSFKMPLNLVVTPSCGQNPALTNIARAAAAIVFLSDPESKPVPNEAALMCLYGLSRAEAKVGSLFGQGKTVRDVSEELRISVNTVKTHLKRVFEKTGTRRQAELVRLVLSSPLTLCSSV